MLSGDPGAWRISGQALWKRAGNPRGRKSIFRRAAGRPQHVPADRDASRAGVRNQWRHGRSRGQYRGQHLPVISALLLSLLISGACEWKRPDAASTYHEIEASVAAGNLAA